MFCRRRRLDFNAWYDTEHLAGLAAVPGVARATRYRVAEGAGPRYHAGYDLAERSAFNSPAWLPSAARPGAHVCARASSTPDARCTSGLREAAGIGSGEHRLINKIANSVAESLDGTVPTGPRS
jgi:hypothetical protein